MFLLLCVLFGPLSAVLHHTTPCQTNIRMDILDNIGRTFQNYQNGKLRFNFLNECKKNRVLPRGISLNFNLALGVNDHGLVDQIQSILDQASSNILETVIVFTEEKSDELNEALEDLKREAIEELGHREFARAFTTIKREKAFEIEAQKSKLKNKVKLLKSERVFGPENFIKSKGSRKLKSKSFKSVLGCDS